MAALHKEDSANLNNKSQKELARRRNTLDSDIPITGNIRMNHVPTQRSDSIQQKKSSINAQVVIRRALRRQQDSKYIKQAKIKRKIRIALRLSIVLREWWTRHLKSIEAMVLSDEHLDLVTKFMMQQTGSQMKQEKTQEMLFDASEYKADRRQRLSQEARRILTLRPQYRNDKEIHYCMVALRAHKQIANFPVRMQRAIAQYGFLECYNEKRAIVKQGHPPTAFYYLFYGTVSVIVSDEVSGVDKIVCILDRGDSFGELAIVSETSRHSSVISKSDVELISISKYVYDEMFTSGGAKKITDPDHDQFIRSLDFLQGWPIHLLDTNSKMLMFTYFQQGSIMVKDSNYSDWLYIIKSGSVKVLKKLQKTRPTVNPKTGEVKAIPKSHSDILRYEAFLLSRYGQFVSENKIIQPDPIRPNAKPKSARKVAMLVAHAALPSLVDTRKRSVSAPLHGSHKANDQTVISPDHRVHTMDAKSLWNKSFGAVKKLIGTSESDTLAEFVKNQIKFVEAEDSEEDHEAMEGIQLGESDEVSKDICESASELLIGKRTWLDDLDKGSHQRSHHITPEDLNPQFVQVQTLTKGSVFGLADMVLEKQPSLSLVSNGAECLLIHKNFYKQHCDGEMLRRLIKSVSPYPSDERMQNDLLCKLNWEVLREATLLQTVSVIPPRRTKFMPNVRNGIIS